jgi:hypothetical protein
MTKYIYSTVVWQINNTKKNKREKQIVCIYISISICKKYFKPTIVMTSIEAQIVWNKSNVISYCHMWMLLCSEYVYIMIIIIYLIDRINHVKDRHINIIIK